LVNQTADRTDHWAALLDMRAKRIELFKQFLPKVMADLPTNGTSKILEAA